jgi:hypothetical protein
VSRWRCPACDREFGRANQGHVCVPGNSVAETFVGRPPIQREIYDAIIDHLRTLGPLHLDAVKVGVFLLNERKLAEIRPMARGLTMWLLLPFPVTDPRVRRTESAAGGRVWHVLRLTQLSDVDDELREWLTEAYELAAL